ncbi:MAG: hypothetical protein K2K30_02150 [Alistipes sp.]|nr:hypothetical protein [Alistipes sp.]
MCRLLVVQIVGDDAHDEEVEKRTPQHGVAQPGSPVASQAANSTPMTAIARQSAFSIRRFIAYRSLE